MNYDKLIKEKYNRIRNYSRFRLGFQQLIAKKYLNIFTFFIILLFHPCWNIAEFIILKLDVEEVLFPLFSYSLHIMAIIFPCIILSYFIYIIGEKRARKDEIALIIAFRREKVFHEPPILLSKYKDKKTGTIVREFYSNLAINIWQKRAEDIADALDSQFVEEKITYGGKNRNNGKRITLYTIKNKKTKGDRNLYE